MSFSARGGVGDVARLPTGVNICSDGPDGQGQRWGDPARGGADEGPLLASGGDQFRPLIDGVLRSRRYGAAMKRPGDVGADFDGYARRWRRENYSLEQGFDGAS